MNGAPSHQQWRGKAKAINKATHQLRLELEGQQLIEQGSKFIRNSQKIKLNAPIIGEIE